MTNINFRWTAQSDYERLGLSNLIKLRKITLTGSSLDGICGIQLTFTDNIQSPLFESQKTKPAQSFQIDPNRVIKYIDGKVRDSRTNRLRLLDSQGLPVFDSQAYYEDGNTVRYEVP